MNAAASTVFSVGQWRVEPALDEISRDGTVIKLEPRTMRVLVSLAERAGEVVSVEQLFDAVWKDVVVTQDSVYQAVASLRRAFGDDPKQPAYIINVVRKGYRLVAPVTDWHPVAPENFVERRSGRNERRRLQRFAVIGMACALAAAVGGSVWYAELRAGQEAEAKQAAVIHERSIAVLPFADMSENHDQEYFADGMAEEVLDMLAKIPQLKVIGRTSSFQFKGKNEDLRSIGAKLGAAYVVQGSVRKAGPRVRITAQLIDVASGTHLWAESYDRDFDDILNVQEAIAVNIGRALQLVVVSEDARPRRPLQNPEAYTFYLRGRAALDRGDAQSLRVAASLLDQALMLDPGFTRAAETLALAHVTLLGNGLESSEVGWHDAERAARTALQLDPGSSLAHGILGLRHTTYDYDFASAARELDLALASKPRDPVALYMCSWLAFNLGRHREAIELGEMSLSIDPLNPDSYQNSAYVYYLTGDMDAAERYTRRSMAISPSFTGNRKLLGQIFLERRQLDAALVELEAESSRSRDIGLAYIYHALGRRSEADAALARAIRDSGDSLPVDIATIYAFRGDRTQAFAWLEKAVAVRELSLGHKFRNEPKLAPLRNDPRYHALLREMNLPP